jgi:hypothetical protein
VVERGLQPFLARFDNRRVHKFVRQERINSYKIIDSISGHDSAKIGKV